MEESMLEKFERGLGLPPISKIADTLQKFPDQTQLKLIRDVLEVAERLSCSSVELEKVIALIKEVNTIPPEKLQALEKVLKRIELIVKKAPKEILDLLTSLRG